ncbi:MAG: hypothetical protein COA84_12410 [Robiginitomaculum sp.]|nr:MAG: hypothetical protein COA84_12410 [Robiginitomaculum sp.]
MIRYALVCSFGHEFEAWFSSSADYDVQNEKKLIACPLCEDHSISKQIMAPSVKSTKKKPALSDAKAFAAFAGKVREKIRDTHDYVGDKFADEALAMHRGEKDEKPIYGETTTQEAEALKDEGVPAAPLPPAFAPTPPKKLN